ncbi:MAG: DUF6444 domain-containing protein [Chloroflexota bacterium]
MSKENFSPNDLGISEEDWQQTPPSVRMLVNRLHQRMEKVEEQLKLNSETSSKPPSSDAPRHRREKEGKLPSGKKRGAQPGHKGRHRKPKPPDEVSEFHVHRPETCQHYGTRSSSDGMRFPVTGDTAYAFTNPKFFGYRRGINVLTHVADIWTPFSTQIISANDREALYVRSLR